MFKKLKVIMGIAALATLSAGLAACAKIGDVEKYQQEGYDVKVTYDASGGKFYNRDGVSIVRMYKSQEYMNGGVAEIKLSDPSVGESAIIPTKSSPLSFFAGWYKTREYCLSANNKPLDEQGRELVEIDGTFYVSGTEDKKEDEQITSNPKYVYSDYWNFEEDTLTVTEENTEPVSLTLYAGWVPYYQFDYYYQGDNGWELYGSTSFDYKDVKAEGSATSDHDTIFTPDWKDGTMSYDHSYSNGDVFSFPNLNMMENKPESLQGKVFTFSAAYEDENCTIPITGSIKHLGTLDAETYTIENRVKNIYVVYDKFEKYKISTPDQLIKYAKTDAHYEITADLNFTGLEWPAAFTTSEFKGEFVSSDGNNFVIKNASAKVGANAQFGGLFGSVSKNAVISNVTFENATVDFMSSSRLSFNFGLFSGNVDESANVSGVTVGGLVKIGAISVPSEYEFNLVANGAANGITNTGISVRIYGENLLTYYNYTINPNKVTVDSTGNLTLAATLNREEREKEIEFVDIISSWRQNND